MVLGWYTAQLQDRGLAVGNEGPVQLLRLWVGMKRAVLVTNLLLVTILS